MKRSYLVLCLAAVLLSLVAVACGPQEKVVGTPARDINLSAADLGPDWSLQAEQGLADMAAMKQAHVQDANLRMFGAERITGMLVSIVLSTNSVASAQEEMKGDAVRKFGQDIREQVPGVTLETLAPPGIGDETAMVGGGHADLGLRIYLMTFRKANVIVMFSLIGSAETVTEELAVDYARKIETRIR